MSKNWWDSPEAHKIESIEFQHKRLRDMLNRQIMPTKKALLTVIELADHNLAELSGMMQLRHEDKQVSS